jgi:hypothetical protein
MTEEQLEKLPKYAQQEIRQLRRSNAYLLQMLTSEENGDTRIYVEYDGNRKYISGQRIYVDDEILIKLDTDSKLTIISVGDREMALKPHSSNSFKVFMHKR